MTSMFNAVAAPFAGAWQLFHKICMPFMFIMLVADPTGFFAHLVHAATLTPDAISNVASVFTPSDGGVSALAAAPTGMEGHAAHGLTATHSAAASCPAAGGAFEDYKQVFDCSTPEYQQSMMDSASATKRSLLDTVKGVCSSGTVVTNKVWDYTP